MIKEEIVENNYNEIVETTQSNEESKVVDKYFL